MEQLKRFVIESVGRAPYPRGWAAGGTPRDIVRAHPARGLTVALGTAGFLDVPWEQVAAVQLAAIAQHYLGRPEVPDDQRTSLAVAMAVFCYESGLFKPAETVAASLLERQPALRDTLDRLMPGFAD